MIASLVAFLAMVLTDICWAFYIRRTAHGRAHQAGLYAVALLVLGGIVVLLYTENPWMLVPAGLGAYAGTFAVVKWDHRR